MRARAVTAIFWLAMAIASFVFYRAERDRQQDVLIAVREASLEERNPVAVEAIGLARDPDHAAASFARAVVVDSLTVTDAIPNDLASSLVLLRSFPAYMPPDRYPNGDYGSELLANQEAIARGSAGVGSPLTSEELTRERGAALRLALDGLALRPGFADHQFAVQMLEATEQRRVSSRSPSLRRSGERVARGHRGDVTSRVRVARRVRGVTNSPTVTSEFTPLTPAPLPAHAGKGVSGGASSSSLRAAVDRSR